MLTLLFPHDQVEDAPVVADAGANLAGASMEDVEKLLAANNDAAAAPSTPKIDVNVSFPDAEIFGVKLVNGRPTRTLLRVTNNEDEPITVLAAVAGLLSPLNTPGAPDPPQSLRNLTGAKFSTVVPAGASETLTYAFATVMQPQDLTLEVKTVVARKEELFTLTVFRENVSVVEAPVSLFDPQM